MRRDLVAYWDAEAATFDRAADHGLTDPCVREMWRRLLASALPPAPARVADLGCGTGSVALLLADMGYVVDGVDFSPRMVAEARRKASGRSRMAYCVGDAADPPLPSQRFDVVFARHVLWALPDPVGAVARWAQLLVPGGRLVLVEGRWYTGAGLSADQALAVLAGANREATVAHLDDPGLWGQVISDERYLLISAQ